MFQNHRNMQEEEDDGESDSYPSIHNIRFSKANAKRTLGRRNNGAKQKENVSSMSNDKTHPINPGVGSLQFLKQFNKTSLSSTKSIEKMGFSSLSYQNRDMCKKNLNLEPQPLSKITNHFPMQEEQKVKLPLQASDDKENIPTDGQFTQLIKTKGILDLNSVFHVVDAPKKNILVDKIELKNEKPPAGISETEQKQIGNNEQINQNNPPKLFETFLNSSNSRPTIQDPITLLNQNHTGLTGKAADNSASSDDSVYETGVMEDPLDLSHSHNIQKSEASQQDLSHVDSFNTANITTVLNLSRSQPDIQIKNNVFGKSVPQSSLPIVTPAETVVTPIYNSNCGNSQPIPTALSNSHPNILTMQSLPPEKSHLNLQTSLPHKSSSLSQPSMPNPSLLTQPHEFTKPVLASQPYVSSKQETNKESKGESHSDTLTFKAPSTVATHQFKKPFLPNEARSVSLENVSHEVKRKPRMENVFQRQAEAKSVAKTKPTGSDQDDLIKVNGKAYKVLRVMGTGGSSTVYLVEEAHECDTKRTMALKVVNLATITDKSISDGYLNEVELLHKLQGCPCVITMYDYMYEEQGKYLYVLLERGDSDLSKYLKAMSKSTVVMNPMFTVVKIWHELLLAVKEIHSRGIIHSDLKPANFLFVGNVLKLIDFGLASALQEDMTSIHNENIMGTMSYISPEAIRKSSSNQMTHRITYKSDVWSLGCILFNMVYGRTPYSHITQPWCKMHAIADLGSEVEFNHVCKVPVPPTLMKSMKMCLQKEPNNRPTVAHLLEMLESRIAQF